MFDWKKFEVHKNIFSQAGSEFYSDRSGQHHVYIRPTEFLRWVDLAKDDLGYLNLVDVAAVHRKNFSQQNEFEFEIVYLLFNMGDHQRLHIHVFYNSGEIIPSASDHFHHAEWMEREQSEMLGVVFDRKMEKLLLPRTASFFPLKQDDEYGPWLKDEIFASPVLRMNPNKTESPYPEESWRWENYGLLEPVSRGLFDWLVCFDPVHVVDSRVRIGFHHRGWEKKLESKNWFNIMQLVDLIQPGVAPTYSVAWAKNLEDSLRIKIPERAQAIRMILLELARISEHLTVLYEMALSLKKEEYSLFIDAREKVCELFEKYSGQRSGTGVVCLGGVKDDLPHGWIIEFQSLSDVLKKNLRIIHRSLLGQKDFREYLDHSGVDAQSVLKWGVSGPSMRASGLNFDLRKSQPLYFYQDVDFDIPVGINGTSYDRYLIRYEEIHQSLRIVTQVLDNLPLGNIVQPELVYFGLGREQLLEELPKDWHYSALEAPNGEVGFNHLNLTGLNPYRIKIKTPSISLAQALPEFVKGANERQLPGVLASLGIRKQELDR